jgi:hypothetical protein
MEKITVKDLNLAKEVGNHWIRVKVDSDGDVLLDNIRISNKKYLRNYLFTDDELALFHITSYNKKVD